VYYKPVGNATLAFSSRAGWKHPYGGDLVVPISERFFAGGSTTLRGFALDELRFEGGQLLAIENVEYRAPLFPVRSRLIKSIGGALFYDTGNVFLEPSNFSLKDFTHTAGAGVRALSPLGPIRLDVGINLLPKLRIRSDGEIARDQRIRVFLTLGNAF
jgi:outer membrane protein insertion porin family